MGWHWVTSLCQLGAPSTAGCASLLLPQPTALSTPSGQLQPDLQRFALIKTRRCLSNSLIRADWERKEEKEEEGRKMGTKQLRDSAGTGLPPMVTFGLKKHDAGVRGVMLPLPGAVGYAGMEATSIAPGPPWSHPMGKVKLPTGCLPPPRCKPAAVPAGAPSCPTSVTSSIPGGWQRAGKGRGGNELPGGARLHNNAAIPALTSGLQVGCSRACSGPTNTSWAAGGFARTPQHQPCSYSVLAVCLHLTLHCKLLLGWGNTCLGLHPCQPSTWWGWAEKTPPASAAKCV